MLAWDDSTSMLWARLMRGNSSIATAETWRLQVFGSKGWAAVGDVEHLHTWELETCFFDPENITVKQRPVRQRFEPGSTERAELEHFAQEAAARRPMALPGGDAVHNVALFQAILASIDSGLPEAVRAPARHG